MLRVVKTCSGAMDSGSDLQMSWLQTSRSQPLLHAAKNHWKLTGLA